MFAIDHPTAFASPPAPRPAATPGFFGPGDTASGQSATTVTYEWANAVQGELLGVLAALGIAPDKTNNGQLWAALQILMPQRLGHTYGVNDWTRLPGGLTIVWGAGTGPASGGSVSQVSITFPITFNNVFIALATANGPAQPAGYHTPAVFKSLTNSGGVVVMDTNLPGSVFFTQTCPFSYLAIGN